MEFEVNFYKIFVTFTWRVAGQGYILIQPIY